MWSLLSGTGEKSERLLWFGLGGTSEERES